MKDPDETLDEWSTFSEVQDGNDLSHHDSDAIGYHYTSERGLSEIENQGLGRHPGVFTEHELYHWVAMPFLEKSVAIRAIREYERGRPDVAAKLVSDALRRSVAARAATMEVAPGASPPTPSSVPRCSRT